MKNSRLNSRLFLIVLCLIHFGTLSCICKASKQGPQSYLFLNQAPSQSQRIQEDSDNETLDDRILIETASYALDKYWEDDDKTNHYIAIYQGTESQYKNSKIIKTLHMIVSFHDQSTFRIKIFDQEEQRWEIPEEFPFPHFKINHVIPKEQGDCNIEVQANPFSFVVTRKSTGEILFDTRNKQFVYSNFYIELSTSLPTANVYGFGERNYKFNLSPGTFTIWGRDDPKILETGGGGFNTYSHHPVGLMRERSGNFFLTLMRNSNAMDVIVSNSPGLTYKMVGGIIDLVFFIGNEYPDTVLKAYHNYLGNFAMMPFWSMGYHQSKWGYKNFQIMETVVKKYMENDIPLDVIWSDIDYMIEKEIFTVDSSRFPPEKMKEFATKYKKKWVPIIDPGVKQQFPKGPGLQAGLDRDIFLKNNRGGNLLGSVWPGRVYFPDFFNPETEQYWSDMLEVLYKMIPFSGIWLDMNEVANFVDGEENRIERNIYDQIPYIPGRRPLKRKTISLDAVHHGGIIEYDVHSLFSVLENAATYKYLQTKSKLPFILTRASSMGVGRFAAHWSGDNGAYWEYLQVSIPGNFNFQIFGIPFVGADICGFMDGTNEELCARWTQLGALYPFARNHHELETRNQEPWTFTGKNRNITLIETTKIAIQTRYSILKWYYSLFIKTNGSGSIFRPLMFEFPREEVFYQDGYNDWEFLLGSSVLCTPKVEPGEPFVDAYFPIATWYELFSGRVVKNKKDANRVERISTPFDASVPLFLRAGHIIHRQKVDNIQSTEDLNDEFELIVGFDREDNSSPLKAQGSIMGIENFDEDSVYYRCIEENCLYDIIATTTKEESNSVWVEIQFKKQKENNNLSLDNLGIYGLKLYGLPLGFMGEDENRVSYALTQLIRENNETTVLSIERLVVIEENAFCITFENTLRVQDGDILSFEIII